jgi:predicted transposase YbfD/YdcC
MNLYSNNKELGMDAQVTGEFLRVFGDLDDPRRANRRYLLCDLILLAVAAVMCGCEGWEDIQDWTAASFEFLEPLMVQPQHGTPSADTFRRVFARLSPEGFERCFVAWTQALRPSSQEQFIALDGKALRGSFAHGWDKTPIHMVSAYASDQRLILGQLKVESKENEIVALPRLLAMLDLRKTTVTIDAMGCQKEIARQIVQAKGHYVLALKENQPTLCAQTKALLDEAILENFQGLKHDYYEATEGDHGRIETRRVWVCDEVGWIKAAADWPGLRQVVVVESCREIYGKVSTERRYYIASHRTLDAQRTAEAIRYHWGIENQVHWILDVIFHEDQSRIRREFGPENFARVRRMVLNKLRAYKDPDGKKYSLRMKRKMCGWRFDYFLKVLTA